MLGTFLKGATAAAVPVDFISSAAAGTGAVAAGTSTFSVTTPTTVAGDYMIAFQFCTIQNTNTNVPAGWTELFRSATSTNTLIVFKRTAVSSEPATHSFNVTTSAISRSSASMLVYRNAVAETVGAITRAASLTITAASIASATRGTLLAAFCWEAISQPITSDPSGMTSRLNFTGNVGVFQRVYDEPWLGGTTGDRTASYSGSAVETVGIQVVLNS